MATIGLVITGLAFLVSILFNLLQLKWRNEERSARAEDKAEQKRKDDEREAEQRLKEQAAPLFFNFDGTPGPILVNGSQHSSQGPFMLKPRVLGFVASGVDPRAGGMGIQCCRFRSQKRKSPLRTLKPRVLRLRRTAGYIEAT